MSSADALPNPLFNAAIARPEHPYVNDLTYGALCRAAQTRATALKALGVEWSGARVGLCGPYDERWIEWAWSLNWLGAVVAPMKPEATAQERAQRSASLSLSRVISLPPGAPAHMNNEALFSRDPMEALARSASPSLSEGLAPEPWRWEQPLFTLTTSGTTGDPKPISLTARAVTMSAFGSMVRLGHLASDRWLSCLPLHHVGGLSIFIRALLQQTSVRRCPPQGERVAQALASGAYQLCSLTPTLLSDTLDALEAMSEAERGGLSAVRALLIGGARTPLGLWERADRLGLPVRLTWGMSEAASQVCTQLESGPPGGALPPLPFQQLSLSELGCLIVRSPTTERGCYETQDLGELDERGWVRVSGRLDDVIITGGVNVHPREVEERLLAHPSVADVGVVGVVDPRWGQSIQAHLRLQQGTARPSDDQLRAWCHDALSPYKCPKVFYWRDALPRDPLGKLLRRHLTHPPHASEVGLMSGE